MLLAEIRQSYHLPLDHQTEECGGREIYTYRVFKIFWETSSNFEFSQYFVLLCIYLSCHHPTHYIFSKKLIVIVIAALLAELIQYWEMSESKSVHKILSLRCFRQIIVLGNKVEVISYRSVTISTIVDKGGCWRRWWICYTPQGWSVL